MTELDATDRAMLNAYQGGFPVVAEPYEPAAAVLRPDLGEPGFGDPAAYLVRHVQTTAVSRPSFVRSPHPNSAFSASGST